jgi:hypothetical protein
MVRRGNWFRPDFGRNEIVGGIVPVALKLPIFIRLTGGYKMTSLTPQELEGRLAAHRELMIEMLAAMIGGEVTITTFLKKLRDDATFKNSEEDPGVIPDTAFAIENASAREMRAILEAARARAAAD